jgi:hypothetical protein
MLDRFPPAVHRLNIEAVHFQQGLQVLSNARFIIHH